MHTCSHYMCSHGLETSSNGKGSSHDELDCYVYGDEKARKSLETTKAASIVFSLIFKHSYRRRRPGSPMAGVSCLCSKRLAKPFSSDVKFPQCLLGLHRSKFAKFVSRSFYIRPRCFFLVFFVLAVLNDSKLPILILVWVAILVDKTYFTLSLS